MVCSVWTLCLHLQVANPGGCHPLWPPWMPAWTLLYLSCRNSRLIWSPYRWVYGTRSLPHCARPVPCTAGKLLRIQVHVWKQLAGQRNTIPEVMLLCRSARPRSCRLGRYKPTSAAVLTSYAPLQQQLLCTSWEARSGCCPTSVLPCAQRITKCPTSMHICVLFSSDMTLLLSFLPHRGGQHRHCSAHGSQLMDYTHQGRCVRRLCLRWVGLHLHHARCQPALCPA